MKLSEIMQAIERRAPLGIQDDYDNSGLQIGSADSDISAALICLDVTEEIVEEAILKGCNLIVSHHPLLFHPLVRISDETYQQRCTVLAIKHGISIYSAHTSLDNARGGVNFKIAEKIGMSNLTWLTQKNGLDAGSGIVGELAEGIIDDNFLQLLKQSFSVEGLRHSATKGQMIKKVALCGGAGAFLMKEARKAGVDCFISGEFHYHDYFENEAMLLAELGHYQSEQFTKELLQGILKEDIPELRVEMTTINTNPISYN